MCYNNFRSNPTFYPSWWYIILGISLKFEYICQQKDYILLKTFKDQTFKAIYLEIYWEKSFRIVVLFCRIILLDDAVVAEKNSKKLYFFT